MFEDGSQTLRRAILSDYSMPFFYSFENQETLFSGVDSRYKFAMMQILNAAPSIDASIKTAHYLRHPAQIAAERIIDYPLTTLKTLSPDQWAMMELRDPRDVPILNQCYQSYPPLSPDWLDFRSELHMTNDKDLFIETARDGLLPLFEGKMIWQFSDQYSTAQYWLDADKFDERMTSKEFYRMAQDIGKKQNECEAHHAQAVRFDRGYHRLGFRVIARDTDERTLIVSMLPKDCGFGHSMFGNIPKTYVLNADGDVLTQDVSALRLLFAQAWLNALPTDWLARFMIQINVSKTYLFRLPMPQPSDDEILNNPDYHRLAKNALRLTLRENWDDFAELAPLFNLTENDLPKTDKIADGLRFDNDKTVAKLYGISEHDLRHILKSFAVLNNKRPEYTAQFKDAGIAPPHELK